MSEIQTQTTLNEAFSAASMGAYIEGMREDAKPYLGEILFPPRKTVGLDIRHAKGKSGAPVVLRPAAFDTAAAVRGRIPFTLINNEMAFWRESMVVGERERQQILRAAATGDPFLQTLLTDLYDDANALVKGADAAVERMRMQLLSTGAIQFAVDGVPYDYAYGFDTAKQFKALTGAAKWDAPDTADPLAALAAAMKAAKLSAARAVLTAETLRTLCACKAVRGAMYTGEAPGFVPQAQVRLFVEEGLRIVFEVIEHEQNAFRERVGGEELQMFPDGVITLLPADGILGETFYGTTPEEADLLLSAHGANVHIVGAGVAVSTHVSPVPPIQLSTTVSQIALPSCGKIDRMYVLKAY